MKIEGPLLKGRFLERPNRFLTLVELNGKTVASHLPDPGRLRELLIPGAEVFLRPAPANSGRKTAYSTVMVKQSNTLISLVSVLPNRFVRECLENQRLPFLRDYRIHQREIPYENHRFDFLLTDSREQPFYLEVKSVTFVSEGIAQFPDAVTERGSRHARTLGVLSSRGIGAGILFVCQRPDAHAFRPMWERDPKFATALQEADRLGVKIWCITTNITEMEMTYSHEIPVNLAPVKLQQTSNDTAA